MHTKFKTPKHVLHVFHNQHAFGKIGNAPACRKELLTWPNQLAYSAGYAEGNAIILNDSIEPHWSDLEQSQMLVMTDYTALSDYQPICDSFFRISKEHALIRDFQHPRNYSIFKITQSNGVFALHLNYGENGAYIGIPHRDDFPLAELKPNEPLRVTINGKSDFSLTARQARRFYLLDYWFVYYGEFSEFKTVPSQSLALPRDFRVSPAKHVDLQKILR